MTFDVEVPYSNLAAAIAENQRYLAKRIPVRLYYKTARGSKYGKLKFRDTLVWLNGVDGFKRNMCKKMRKGQTIPRLDNAKLTHCAGYIPYGCVGIKLVRLLANGTEGKLLALGEGIRN